jgi:hypothetical protein
MWIPRIDFPVSGPFAFTAGEEDPTTQLVRCSCKLLAKEAIPPVLELAHNRRKIFL